ncbi:hypothetical protein C2I18_15185 [Paenibacillus sp. PK3_47]|uniref:DUF4129 domain-containing transglutaminase family protein n=1 Tax=Paenibacillus sp. PK3_47 TaxID=2072642 RepID=UPI00201E58EE|nr:transglutaminase domain-containing protein [Paenibacillus sp. PK3_47]UQZ34750.1 hypothetical protein C2I18_15185 [Paenibacillus sp. PK3_47]
MSIREARDSGSMPGQEGSLVSLGETAVHPEQAENSPTDNREDIPLYYRVLFSLAILGIFVQWLLPLHRSTGAADTVELLEILMTSAAVLLLSGSLQRPGPLQLGVQFSLMLLTWVYACAGYQWTEWLKAYISGIPEAASQIFSGQLSALGEDNRLLILILGWGLLVCSVQQLALYRGSTALFILVSIGYLLALDIGFGVNTAADVLIVLGLIVWMQGMNGLLRLKERTGSINLPYIRWGGLALAAAAVLTTAAWLGGQLHGANPAVPARLQPVFEQLQSWAEGQAIRQGAEFRNGTGTTGYGSGNAELGAPLTPSGKPAFTVTSSRPAYWRGESMALYDGRKWKHDYSAPERLSLTGFPLQQAEGEAPPADQALLVQRIKFAVPSSGRLPVFSAGKLHNIGQVELTDGSRLGYVLANRERDSFRLPEASGTARVAEYTVSSVLPVHDPAVLRKLTGEDPGEVAAAYLQLPEGLPGRIAGLSAELTGSAENRYDAVTAVRDYLQHGYSYTLDTRIPPEGADFADDFLFVTKEGYCVHFATAMTVLLRSSGIPARYVQGYGPGTPLADAVPQQFKVTEGDAHAWVEAYFPGAGWVPFDPTPAALLAAADPAASAAAASAPQQPSASARSAADALPALPQAGGNPAPPAAAAALLLAAAVRWRRSLALLPAVRAGSLSRERQLRAAALAWHGLAARYGPPPPGVTAREYAASLQIPDAALHAAVGQFVRQWETLAYSGAAPQAARVPAGSPGQPSIPAAGPSAPPSAADGRDFIRRCLLITFRLA